MRLSIPLPDTSITQTKGSVSRHGDRNNNTALGRARAVVRFVMPVMPLASLPRDNVVREKEREREREREHYDVRMVDSTMTISFPMSC